MKMKQLQQNGQELMEREARLAQERYDLSRERLELQALRRKVFESRCSLCKIGERSQQLSDMLAKSGIDTQPPRMGDVADLDTGPIGEANTVRFGDDNFKEMLDFEVGVEIEKLKKYGASGFDDEHDSLLDPELMIHRLDVMKGFDDL